MLVNLRIVLSATAVTILLLLVGFGVVGALFLVRSPEPPPARISGHMLDLSPSTTATKLDPPAKTTKTEKIMAPAVLPEANGQAETTAPASPAAAFEPKKETEIVPPPVIAAPSAAPEITTPPEMALAAPAPAVPEAAAAPEAADPVATGAVNPKPEVTKRKQLAPARKARPPARRRTRAAQRPAAAPKAAPQYSNPFSQLFGKQYK